MKSIVTWPRRRRILECSEYVTVNLLTISLLLPVWCLFRIVRSPKHSRRPGRRQTRRMMRRWAHWIPSVWFLLLWLTARGSSCNPTAVIRRRRFGQTWSKRGCFKLIGTSFQFHGAVAGMTTTCNGPMLGAAFASLWSGAQKDEELVKMLLILVTCTPGNSGTVHNTPPATNLCCKVKSTTPKVHSNNKAHFTTNLKILKKPTELPALLNIHTYLCLVSLVLSVGFGLEWWRCSNLSKQTQVNTVFLDKENWYWALNNTCHASYHV